jgi:hypothetical protein
MHVTHEEEDTCMSRIAGQLAGCCLSDQDSKIQGCCSLLVVGLFCLSYQDSKIQGCCSLFLAPPPGETKLVRPGTSFYFFQKQACFWAIRR